MQFQTVAALRACADYVLAKFQTAGKVQSYAQPAGSQSVQRFDVIKIFSVRHENEHQESRIHVVLKICSIPEFQPFFWNHYFKVSDKNEFWGSC